MKCMVPEAALLQHVAILGKTGAGKSYCAKGIVEGLLADKRQCCILDPTGAWYGLRLAADGKGRGFDVVLLGGKHADIPLAERSGAAVARLVTEILRARIAEAGAAAAVQVDPAEAIERAKGGLTARQARFFEVIVAAHPGEVTREEIAEQFRLHPRGGSLGEDLGRLVGRGLVEGSRGKYRARDFLFAGR